MKGKGQLVLVITLIAAVGINVLAYFGIGTSSLLGVGNINLGLDLRGGVSIVYEADSANPTKDEMDAAVALIRGRLDRRGYTEAEAGQEGANRIRVDIPGVEDAEQAVEEIGQTAMLYFKDEDGNILLSGVNVKDAQKVVYSQGQGRANEVMVSLEFDSEGSQLFEEATANNIGKTIAIYLDDTLLGNPPVVNEKISGGSAVISGSFTSVYAEEMAANIRAGALPFGLNVIYMNQVGAKLGADALTRSIMAGFIGTALILVFMAVTYKILGAAADLALFIYAGLLLVILSLFGVTLTLPGIAGIILSISMAVDANIIIFERIKDELRTGGRALGSAVEIGFKRAFPAILDQNVTTLIAASVLFWLGTGPVKGFAQTLSIGVLLSMFTALILTRLLVYGLIDIGVNNPNWYLPKQGGKAQ